jgi:hypothetical protein
MQSIVVGSSGGGRGGGGSKGRGDIAPIRQTRQMDAYSARQSSGGGHNQRRGVEDTT